jgi:hypothetical protein
MVPRYDLGEITMAIKFTYAQFELTRDENGNQQDVRHDLGSFGFGDDELLEMAFDNLPTSTGIKLVDVDGPAEFGKVLLDLAVDPDCRETTELNFASLDALIFEHGLGVLEALFQTDAISVALKHGDLYGSGRIIFAEGITYAINMGLKFHEWSHGTSRREFVAGCEGEEWQEIPERAKNCPGMLDHLFEHHTKDLKEIEVYVTRHGQSLREYFYFCDAGIREGLNM